MKTRQLLSIFFLVSVTVVGQTPSQTPTNNKADTTTTPATITKMTLEAFQGIVQSLGFPTTRGKDKDGKDETFFTFRMEDYRVSGFLDGTDTIILYNNFSDLHPPLTLANTWNINNYYCRAVIDSDGNPALAADL